MGLVQYQYTAPPATAHLAAAPFHVPFFAGPEAVDAARRGIAARAAVGRRAGRRRRIGARNIVRLFLFSSANSRERATFASAGIVGGWAEGTFVRRWKLGSSRVGSISCLEMGGSAEILGRVGSRIVGRSRENAPVT